MSARLSDSPQKVSIKCLKTSPSIRYSSVLRAKVEFARVKLSENGTYLLFWAAASIEAGELVMPRQVYI